MSDSNAVSKFNELVLKLSRVELTELFKKLCNIEKNTGRTSKTWYYKVTASTAYGSKTTTGSFTQSGGCKEYTGSTTEYDLQALDITIDACATSATVTVQGRSRTVSGYSDGTTSASTWSSWSNLSSSNYTLSYYPSLGKNETSSVKTYTVTATANQGYKFVGWYRTICNSKWSCYLFY